MQQQASQSTELFWNLLTLAQVLCSKSSIMTESLPTSRVTMRPQAPSDDFFSDSSLILFRQKRKNRQGKLHPRKCKKLGSLVARTLGIKIVR